MYNALGHDTEICLWCDGIEEKESDKVATKRYKKDDRSPMSRREEKEAAVWMKLSRN